MHEYAASIPDIAGLFAIARQLDTTVDALFYDNNEVYYLGIDGGGTKTALLLTDADCISVREEYTDACNPMDIGLDRAKDILRTAIRKICADLPMSSIVMFAGIAGTASESVRQNMNAFFATF